MFLKSGDTHIHVCVCKVTLCLWCVSVYVRVKCASVQMSYYVLNKFC